MSSLTVAINNKTTLFVSGLGPEVDETILYAAFLPFGEILHTQIPTDPSSKSHA